MRDKWGITALMRMFETDRVNEVDFTSNNFKILFESEFNIVSNDGWTLLIKMFGCAS